jgi:hypothetical protein
MIAENLIRRITFSYEVESRLARADTRVVTLRGLSLVVIVLALAIGGYVFAKQARTTGPTSQLVEQAKADASVAVAAANFQAALPAMEAWFAQQTTYVGAQLPPAFGVIVARADATSYCLQDAAGRQHLDGPGGTLQPGPC